PASPDITSIPRHTQLLDEIPVLEKHATVVPQEHDQIQVATASGRSLCAERLLVAPGRRPPTEHLNLPAAGITTDQEGFILVDDHQRTTNARVFAAGDVTAAPQYVYVAAATGKAAAANALRTDPQVPATK